MKRQATNIYATRYDDGDLKGYWATAYDALGNVVREGFAYTKADILTIARTLGVPSDRIDVERRTR